MQWYNELTCEPINLPSSHCPNVTGGEDQIDHIASARNFGWQSGVEDLAPDYEFAVESSSTSLLHQGRPVTVFDDKGVHTKGTMKLSVKSCEFQQKNKPLLHHNCFSLFEAVRILFRVVWRGDNACRINNHNAE